MVVLDVLIALMLLGWLSCLLLHAAAGLAHLLIAAAFVLFIVRHIGGGGDDRRHAGH
jgi:hypothetical protein